jgi:hypothetical protein
MLRFLLLLGATLCAAALPVSAETLTIEGDASGLTLVADGVARNTAVSEISKRLGMHMSGAPIGEEAVSGRFTGNLAAVLKKLLPDNGFVIAYENGRPVRIVFTGRGSGPTQPGVPYIDPATGTPDPML